jgi:hypothetical protein
MAYIETPDTESLSMEESAAAAYDALQEKEAAVEAPEVEAEVEAEPAPEAAAEKPLRAKDGKFAAVKDGAESAAPAKAKPSKETPDTASEVPAAEEPTAPIVAPPSMSAADKAAFAKLTPEMRAFVARRESEVERGFQQKTQELAAQKRTYDQLDQVLQPRRQQIALQGLSPAQAIDQLFALSDFATTDPSGFIKYFAGQRGVDLRTMVPDPNQPAPVVDPALAAIQKSLQDQERRIQAFTTQQSRTQEEQIQAELSSFQTAVDATGQPAHPHFEAVRVAMGALMQSGQAPDLQAAYDMAVYANPTTRAQLFNEQAAAVEKKRQDDVRAKAAAAKKAAGTVITPRGTVPVKPAVKSLEDTAREVYDRMNGAA